jgi:chaperonin GroES
LGLIHVNHSFVKKGEIMSKRTFKPLSNRVIVKPKEEEKITASGIVLPGSSNEKPTLGEVIAVGPGKANDAGDVIKLSVNVGDIVLHSKYGGTEVEVDGETLIILSEDDVLAVQQS